MADDEPTVPHVYRNSCLFFNVLERMINVFINYRNRQAQVCIDSMLLSNTSVQV
jgi:hypothetical protein